MTSWTVWGWPLEFNVVGLLSTTTIKSNNSKMMRLITSYNKDTTTITAAAVCSVTGKLWAAAVLQYSEDATGPGIGLQHLDQYGNHLADDAPDELNRIWGDLIQGAFAEHVLNSNVGGSTAWDVMKNTPDFTSNESLSENRKMALLALARSNEPSALKPANH